MGGKICEYWFEKEKEAKGQARVVVEGERVCCDRGKKIEDEG